MISIFEQRTKLYEKRMKIKIYDMQRCILKPASLQASHVMIAVVVVVGRN